MYEIHLRGLLPPEVAARLGVRTRVEAPAQTVLLTGRIPRVGVDELINRLKDFGIELLELRRCTARGVVAEREPR